MEDDTPPIVRLLQSPEGQDVIKALWDSYEQTRDPIVALDRAKRVAENNGVWNKGIVILVIEVLGSIFKNFGEKK
jgi:hypothetical protein